MADKPEIKIRLINTLSVSHAMPNEIIEMNKNYAKFGEDMDSLLNKRMGIELVEYLNKNACKNLVVRLRELDVRRTHMETTFTKIISVGEAYVEEGA